MSLVCVCDVDVCQVLAGVCVCTLCEVASICIVWMCILFMWCGGVVCVFVDVCLRVHCECAGLRGCR